MASVRGLSAPPGRRRSSRGIPSGPGSSGSRIPAAGLGRGQLRSAGRCEHRVAADLVPVLGQLAQVRTGHVAGRPDRAGDDVERLRAAGSGCSIRAAVSWSASRRQGQLTTGARGVARRPAGRPGRAAGGGGSSPRAGTASGRTRITAVRQDGQHADQPRAPYPVQPRATARPPAVPPILPQRVPLGGEPCVPAADPGPPGLGGAAGDSFPCRG